jgi:hypothetical protein
MKNLSGIAGKTVRLEVLNRAGDPGALLGYEDPARGDTYVSSGLSGYFWNIFEKTMAEAGLVVVADGPGAPPAPLVRAIPLDVGAWAWSFKVEARKGGTAVFKKTFRVSGDAQIASPEKRACAMANALMVQVLSDPSFRKALE